MVKPAHSAHSSAVARIEAILRRIEEVEPEIRALLPEEDRTGRLRRAAEAIDRRRADADDLPPGLVVGVKDIFRVEGFPTRAGSRLPPEELAGPQASAVTRLLGRGAIVLGKTVTTEFAYFAPGPTRNPRNPAHTPGGSSSGSAAAVAAGLCDLALGTQTIGSVIRPASFCGVVGFKPSFGRVAIDGVIPLAPSFDHVGWFAADVAGARRAARILIENWVEGPASEAPRLAIPAGPYLDRAGRIARDHFDRAAETLTAAGIPVRTVPILDNFDAIVARHQTILSAEAAGVHAEWFRRYADRYHERTAQLLRDGQAVAADNLASARREQTRFRDELLSTMDRAGVDAWIAPSTIGPAPRGLESTGDPVMNLPWTQAGLPAITLPIGNDSDGLPLGLQIIGRLGDDARLFSWAGHLEEVLGDRSRRQAAS